MNTLTPAYKKVYSSGRLKWLFGAWVTLALPHCKVQIQLFYNGVKPKDLRWLQIIMLLCLFTFAIIFHPADISQEFYPKT